MPTLDWIGKKAVVNHHREVPFHLLKEVPELSCGDPSSGNLIVEGDNLLALKALLPYYAGKVKCIYIDPPYNTGDEGWVYNDNVNSPEMRDWLGKIVGKEAEDLSRHDKWLCMMYPRLSVLRDFLTEDGLIFVSIDEHEVVNLRNILDEIFRPQNFLATLVWKRRSSSAMRGMPLSIDHEYVIAYGKDSKKTKIYGYSKGIESYPNKDARGNYASTDLTVGMGRDARPNQYFPITNPRTGVEYPANPERVWRFFPETMEKIINQDLVIWPDDHPDKKMTRPRYKTYFDPESEKPKPISTWIESPNAKVQDEEESDLSVLRSGMTQEGGKILQEILGTKSFAYPKPVSLIRSLIEATTQSDDIVLDSFGGSGTTAHATLELNKETKSDRRFILIEIENNVAREITRSRVSKISGGYKTSKSKKIPGLGGGFKYVQLSHPVYDESGRINESVTFPDLARHVFFTETGTPLPAEATLDTPLIGAAHGRAVYLLYNGILKDKSAQGGNRLTRKVLQDLPPFDGPKVIYGTACQLGQELLQKHQVTFKQIPYAIKNV